MPEAALEYAGKALGLASAFLVPVVILLFVALRLRRRVPYPHGLLAGPGKAAPAALLFKRLRPYLDAALDAVAAIVVGLAIAGPPPRSGEGPVGKGVAVALDCSASALFGSRGDRALDEAARILLSDESLAGADLFALSWDPSTQSYVADDASDILAAAKDPLALADALESGRAFVAADLGLAGRLAAKGYSRVVLLTDHPGATGYGVELRRLERGAPRYVYPVGLARRSGDRLELGFVSSGGAALEGVWRIGADGLLSRAKPEHYTLRPERSGFALVVSDPGLWAVEWDKRFTPIEAPAPPPPAAAEGPLSERIVSALGLAGGPAGAPALPAGGPGGPRTGRAGTASTKGALGLALRDGRREGGQGVVYVSESDDDGFVVPPGLTLGRPVAAGASPGLAIGPAGKSSPEMALPFALAALSASSRAYAVPPPPKPAGPATATSALPRGAATSRKGLVRIGEGYVYLEGAPSGLGSKVALPPVSEYAPGAERPAARRVGRPEPRWLVAAILALLLAAKWLAFRARR